MVRLTRRAACGIGVVILPLMIGLMVLDPVRAQQSNPDGGEAPASLLEPNSKQGNESLNSKKDSNDPDDNLGPEEPTVDAAKLRPDVKLPRIVFRLVDGKTNSVLANTTVKLRRLNTVVRPFQFEPEIREIASDQEGIVALSLPGISEEFEVDNFEIDVDGKATDVVMFSVQRTVDEYPLRTIPLLPGLEIVTRIFDADGQPASDARVHILSDWGSKHFAMCESYAFCANDGTLRFRVPQNSTFGLIVTGERGAPFRMVYPAGTENVRDIRLLRGAVISGQLIDRNGKPISNGDIVLNGDDTQAIATELHVGRHGVGGMPLQFMRSTDEQGRFRFPPMTGSVRIQLHESDDNQAGRTDTWEPQTQTALSQLLDRESRANQLASKDGSGGKKRIGFLYLENKSSDEIGDFGDKIYQKIAATISKSDSFELVNNQAAKAGLKQAGLNPDDLYVPNARLRLAQIMKQQQEPTDYFLFATTTSVTTRITKKNDKSDYLLTLELMNMESGKTDKSSADIRQGVRHHLAGTLIPVDLDLPASGDVWVPLMLSPTGTVSGTVRHENGKPVSEVEVDVLIPPRISRSYVRLCRVDTDDAGHYELQVPFPVDVMHISCYGCDEDGNFVHARPVSADASDIHGAHKVLKHYVGESITIDWVLPSKRKPSGRNQLKPVTDPAWRPLAELEAEIKKMMDARDDPRESMTDRCLEFEAQHRGTRMAIGALHFVTRAKATSSSRKPHNACLRAIEVMKDHYINHPDVDLLITEFDAGDGMPGCDSLLLKLSEESPYAYVRAQSLFELAKQRFLMTHLKEKIVTDSEEPDEEQEKFIAIQTAEVRDLFERRKDIHKILSEMDSDSLRQSALELLERVITGYQGIAPPVRYFEGTTGENYPHLMLADKPERPTWKVRTPAERAEILRFQKTRLQEGMKAPEIEGLDLHQRPIRLSQFHGKFVLLTLTLGNVENELFAECARIVKSLKDDEFVCVSVIPGQGSGGYSARAIVEDGKVTWPIIRDSAEDDIANFWCQSTFPSMYLIDPQGFICSIDEGNYMIPELRNRVRTQISQWKKTQNGSNK